MTHVFSSDCVPDTVMKRDTITIRHITSHPIEDIVCRGFRGTKSYHLQTKAGDNVSSRPRTVCQECIEVVRGIRVSREDLGDVGQSFTFFLL